MVVVSGRLGMGAGVHLVVPPLARAALPAAVFVRALRMSTHRVLGARGLLPCRRIDTEVAEFCLHILDSVVAEVVDEARVTTREGPVALVAHGSI